MLSGNLGVAPAHCASGKGAALNSCLPRLLAHINLKHWIGMGDWFLNVKVKPWSSAATVFLRLLSRCWEKKKAPLLIWSRPLNLCQLNLTRPVRQQGRRLEMSALNLWQHRKICFACIAGVIIAGDTVVLRDGSYPGSRRDWDAEESCLAGRQPTPIFVIPSLPPVSHHPPDILWIYFWSPSMYNLNHLSGEIGSLYDRIVHVPFVSTKNKVET